MAEAVFPAGGPSAAVAGILPFLYLADLQTLDGRLIVRVPCSIWPAQGTNTAGRGRHHTHTGEAHHAHGAALQVPNRRLVIASGPLTGVYTVVNAVVQPFVPHVQLELLSRAA